MSRMKENHAQADKSYKELGLYLSVIIFPSQWYFLQCLLHSPNSQCRWSMAMMVSYGRASHFCVLSPSCHFVFIILAISKFQGFQNGESSLPLFVRHGVGI